MYLDLCGKLQNTDKKKIKQIWVNEIMFWGSKITGKVMKLRDSCSFGKKLQST